MMLVTAIGTTLVYTKTLAGKQKSIEDDRIRPELKWEEGDGHVVLWQMILVRDHGAISMDDTDQSSSPTVVMSQV
jgi:hypothetical protein